MPGPGVTVLGNLSIDFVDHGPPSPGGCPSFAGVALAPLGDRARIVVRAAPADLPLFAAMLAAVPVPHAVLPASTTSSFSLVYAGHSRAMTVERIGPVWTPDDIRAAQIQTEWVHVAPLLRSDFPSATIASLVAGGHKVSYDGQGLVRAPRLGPMALDRDFDVSTLRGVQVLNISEDEVLVATGSALDAATVRRFAVPEILVTRGTDGCDLYVDGERVHVPIAWLVDGVQTTGAGDMFTVSYVAARSEGLEPVAAATRASAFVAEQLQLRV